MHKICSITLLSALLLSCAMEPSAESTPTFNPAADSLAILKNFEKQAACWNAGDLECYMEAYDSSDVVQTISRAGVEKGYARILSNYQRYFPKDRMGKLHFDALQLKRLSDQYYYVVGRFNLFYEKADTTIQGWFSVLMEKKNTRWLMISDHSS